MVFGWDRVGRRLHFFSTCMVFLGSCFSAVWIVVANSWQQTPAGYHLVTEGLRTRAEITEFWAMVFNPSAMPRLAHTLTGAFILSAFFVMSVSAWYLLQRRHQDFARRSFTMALGVALLGSFVALGTGHWHAEVVAEHQPAKLAAFEGHFHSSDGGAPLALLGWPDEERGELRMGVTVPGGLSLLVHGDTTTPVPGLDAFPREDWPPVAVPFAAYHLMIGLGTAYIGFTLLCALQLWRGRLFEQRWLLWLAVFAVIGPVLTNQAGWVAAEVGRQPWLVWGMLRTADGLSEAIVAEHVLASIILFGLVYLMLAAVWIFVLDRKIRHGPDEPPKDLRPTRDGGLLTGRLLDVLVAKGEGLAGTHSTESEEVRP